MDFLKVMGIDKEKEVNEALLAASQKFATELQCSAHDVQIAIQFDAKGLYGLLNKKITHANGAKEWKFIRYIQMAEII